MLAVILLLLLIIIIIQGFCHPSVISEMLQTLASKPVRAGEDSVLEEPGL